MKNDEYQDRGTIEYALGSMYISFTVVMLVVIADGIYLRLIGG